MLRTFYDGLRDRLGPDARTDGGTVARSPDAPSIGGGSHCPTDGCDGVTELVAVDDLVESEDPAEWGVGTAARSDGRTMIGRCTACDEFHRDVPDPGDW